MLSRWPTNPFGIVPSAPITVGTTLDLIMIMIIIIIIIIIIINEML